MNNLNAIGLSTGLSDQLATKLNTLLASYQIFYQNARAFHWNIKGEKFFELHLKFEELYTDALTKIDEIAERILTLGSVPTHTFSDYLAASQVRESRHVSEGRAALGAVRESLQTLLVLEREILNLAGEAGDEGTSALMSDYIRSQEKQVWMYSAYLKD